MKVFINKILIKLTGYRLINNINFNIQLNKSNSNSFEFLQMVNDMKLNNELVNFFNESKSQILQDLFVILKLNFKTNGFFVEFGATNGLNLSNTYLLEKKLNWNGILVEPSKKFQAELKNNRNCHIDYRCVYNKTGDLVVFNEVEEGELSTINKYSNSDGHSNTRKKGLKYEVETITLESLLIEYNSPNIIDYLSIDTEGSEFDILKIFNFDKYQFKIITVEHNFTKNRDKIKNLLESKGYTRVYENHSRWDDWYICNELFN
jgi:FkbM family methyltransferase